jgi:hypothetical protein
MLKKAQVLWMPTIALVLLCAHPLHAATIVAGTCRPALPHFSTIQAAVNAAPQGGTVLVCPGTYPEKIAIFHPLTLKGVDNNGTNLARITMPPGGTGTQLYVQATDVNISDLTIDGSNNGATACGQGPYGIVYTDSSGVIDQVAVRNQIPSGAGLGGCFDGFGILVDNFTSAANVTVQNSAIHSFQAGGIAAYYRGTSLTIKNDFIGSSANASSVGANGILIAFAASATITSNSVSDVVTPISYPNFGAAGFGIAIQCSQGVTISGNDVGNTQGGIVVGSFFCNSTSGNADGNTIENNHVHGTHIFDAYYVCGNFNLFEGNAALSTSEAGIRLDGTCNPGTSGFFNTISGNTVNEACTTTLQDPAVASQNTVGSNRSSNVVFDNLFGTLLSGGTCAAAPAIATGSNLSQTTRFQPPTVLR